MNTSILAIRLSRRAVATAVFEDETVAWQEGHHLPSRRERACAAAIRNVMRAVDQIQPAIVFVYAPTTRDGTTANVQERLNEALIEKHIEVQRVTTSELLSAFGCQPLKTVQEVRAIVEEAWASVAAITSRTKPYMASAVAVALYGETLVALRGVP